jgi:hypothetical protein
LSSDLTYHLSSRLFCPESQLQELSKNYFPPVTDFVQLDPHKKTTFWYKPVDKLVIHHTNKLLLQDPALKFKTVDIVFGGDHGKRKFRAIIKVLYLGEDGEPIRLAKHIVGHIDREKDTYEILKSTVGPPINESLKRIVHGQLANSRCSQHVKILMKEVCRHSQVTTDTIVCLAMGMWQAILCLTPLQCEYL